MQICRAYGSFGSNERHEHRDDLRPNNRPASRRGGALNASPAPRFPRSTRDRLRVLKNPDGAPLEPGAAGAPRARLSLVGGRPRLVLGGDTARRRAIVRDELESSLPDALVLEATEVWEILQLAHRAGLVVLVGDLLDAPARAVMRLLAHRHPDLNVISLADSTADPASAR